MTLSKSMCQIEYVDKNKNELNIVVYFVKDL